MPGPSKTALTALLAGGVLALAAACADTQAPVRPPERGDGGAPYHTIDESVRETASRRRPVSPGIDADLRGNGPLPPPGSPGAPGGGGSGPGLPGMPMRPDATTIPTPRGTTFPLPGGTTIPTPGDPLNPNPVTTTIPVPGRN
jgi:hypothetical protein